MRKIIAAINTTIDGFCDHTAGIADQEIHDHYTALLNSASVALYGRTTYELMKFWPTIIENPSEEQSMNDFAAAIDRIPKLVFSHTLKESDLGWNSAKLADQSLEEAAKALKRQPGGDILIGSRSLIVQLINLNLVDELRLCVHPVVIGKGLPLFDQIKDRTIFKLSATKTFTSGAILLCYKRA